MFCYVCGEFTLIKQRCTITEQIKKSHLRYFGVQIGDQDKPWAPHIVCSCCRVKFIRWENVASRSFMFGVPMIWREPTDCTNDCYFCMMKTAGFNVKNKHLIKYPNIPSALRPVAHSSGVAIPNTYFTIEDIDQRMESDVHLPCNDQHKPIKEKSSSSSSSFTQAELNAGARFGIKQRKLRTVGLQVKREECSCSWH